MDRTQGGWSTTVCVVKGSLVGMRLRGSGSTSARRGTGTTASASPDARLYPDGRRIDYKTGVTTYVDTTRRSPTVTALEAQLHSRYLTLAEREKIADLRRQRLSRIR